MKPHGLLCFVVGVCAVSGWSLPVSLQQRIDAVAANGGGRVVVEAGLWETGKIHLRSGVELHLEAGAVLSFSDCPNDYLPEVRTSWQGAETYNLSPLVYAFGCTNVSITGEGVLRTDNARWGRWAAESSHRRPQFIQFFLCRNVLVSGVTIQGTPFWTIHLYRTDDAVIKNVDVSAFDRSGLALKNSDGIDIECAKRVHVIGCSFRQNDDAIVLKSGRDEDGIRRGLPTEDVCVENCVVHAGHCLFGVGSEVGGGIRNVVMKNCKVTGSVSQLLFVKTNAKRGGFIENVTMEDVTADLCRGSIVRLVADYWYYPGPHVKRFHRTPIRGIMVRNVRVGEANAVVDLRGDSELKAANIVIDNVCVDTVRTFVARAVNVSGLHLGRVDISNPPVLPLGPDDSSREGQEDDLPNE